MTKKYKLAGIKKAVKEVDLYIEKASTEQVSPIYFWFIIHCRPIYSTWHEYSPFQCKPERARKIRVKKERTGSDSEQCFDEFDDPSATQANQTITCSMPKNNENLEKEMRLLDEENDSLRSALKSLLESEIRSKNKIRTASEEANKQKHRIASLEHELSAARDSEISVKIQLTSKESDLASEKAVKSGLKKRLSEKTNEIEQIRDSGNKVAAQIAEMTDAAKKAGADIIALKKAAAKWDSEIVELNEQTRTALKNEEQARAELSSKTAELALVTESEEKLEQQVSQNLADISQCRDDAKKAGDDIAALEEAVAKRDS